MSDPLEPWRREKERAVEEIIKNTPSEADQLDQIAKLRGWYDPYGEANAIIKQYMLGDVKVDEAAAKLAEPIDSVYTSADGGWAFYENEAIARNQRGFHSPEKAEDMWGVEQDFEKPAGDQRDAPSTESLLWRLWFGVCHMSRKTPWDDEAKQMKLLKLVQTLKARPDPPWPANITTPMKRSWIWSSGKVWSDLSLFGASARETWNDSPGGGAGLSVPEVHAWTNTNAFFARVSREKVAYYWNYGIWALRDVLEQEPRGNIVASGAQRLDALIPSAVVWINVAGKDMYGYIVENDPNPSARIDVNGPPPQLPWKGEGTWTIARWVFWKEKFRLLATRNTLAEETKKIASEAADLMDAIEIGVNGDS